MPRCHDYIVYKDITDKWQAIEYDRLSDTDDTDYVQDIYDKGGRIQGFVYMPSKNEAINYIEEVTR